MKTRISNIEKCFVKMLGDKSSIQIRIYTLITII